MSVRGWLNRNSVTATLVAVVVLVVALAIVVMQIGGPSVDPDEAYFWNLDTGESFTATLHDVPPIPSPTGGTGVRAHLYTCGACAPDQWFGYLETFGHLDSTGQLRADDADGDHLIRALDGERWVPHFSSAGEQILATVQDPGRCDGPARHPQECLP